MPKRLQDLSSRPRLPCGVQREKALIKNATSKAERDLLRQRDLLLFFRGKCTPFRWDWGEKKVNRGKVIRRDVMRQLKDAGPDVRIECTGSTAELGEVRLLAVCLPV